MLEYCRGAKEEGEALSNTMMKKLSGRQYFDNFYYKTKYYLPDSCFIIILPKTANIKATGIMMTGLFFPYLPIVYPIDWLRPNPLT